MATRDSGVPIALTRAPSAPVPAADVAVQLHAEDAVAIAKQALAAGTTLRLEDGTEVRTLPDDPARSQGGDLPRSQPDEPVRRYGQMIGFATQDDHAGRARPHPQPLGRRAASSSTTPSRATTQPVEFVPRRSGAPSWASAAPTAGSARATTSRSSPRSTARRRPTAAVAEYFRDPGVAGRLPERRRRDRASPTRAAAARTSARPTSHLLQRTLAGIVDHPNVGGYVILSLGCEVNQPTT